MVCSAQSFTGIIVSMEREMTPYLQLMKGLPPLVSVEVWDGKCGSCAMTTLAQQ